MAAAGPGQLRVPHKAVPAPAISHYGAPIGSVLTVNDDTNGPAQWTVRVNSVRPYSDPYATPPAGTRLVAVNVTYTAVKGTASPNPFDWHSKTGSGQTYDSQGGANDGGLNSDNIAAGQKTTGDVVLAVPTSGHVTAVYSDGMSEAGSWAIG
jgi:Domain of unknown function (DUF1942)